MKKLVLFLFTAVMILSVRGFAQSNCNAPTGLAASLHAPEWNNVLLNWNAIEDSTQASIMWSTTTLYTRIGSTTGGNFIGTIRFTPTELASYAGRYLSSISFIPGNAADIAPTTFTIKVWQGGSIVDDTVFNPGTLIVNQPITAQLTPSVMNTILLDTAQLIDVTQELWIGIHCVFDTTAYPLGASNNTGVAGNGLLIYDYDDEEWGDLTNSSSLSNYNWIIIGNLQEASNILSGYNIYRDDALIATVGATNYLDSVPNGDYTYGLTALYGSGCESAPVTVAVSMNSNPCADCLDTVIVDGGGVSSTSYILPLNTYYNYSFSEQIYTTADLGTIDGAINCISFQYIYGTPQSKDIVVYLGNTSKSSFSGGDWIPVSEMFQVFNGTINFTNAGIDNWVNIPFDIPFEYDGSSNIVVAVLNNTGSYVTSNNPTFNVHSASSKSLYLQNDSSPYSVNSLGSGSVGSDRSNIRFLVGEPVVCPMPTHMTVSNVTTDGATITWYSSDSHNGYELVFVPDGSTVNNETPVTVNDTFYVATDLIGNTHYSVYLRANCGADNSFWNIQDFKTLCTPTSQLPYVVDMDGFGVGSAIIPDCAERGLGGNSASYPYLSSSYHHSGNASLYFYTYTPNSAMIRFQGLDLTDNTAPLVMRFQEYVTSSGYGYLQAGYMTDPTDFNSFVLVKTVYPNEIATANWTEVSFALPEAVNGHLIFPTLYCPFAPGSSYNYIYIDDIVIEPGQTTCMAPHNMHFSNITGSSAQVSWTSDATATGTETYHVEYSETGTDNWQSVTTTGNACLISGLSQQTVYEVRLFMDCDENGYSDTLTGTLITNCLAGGEIAIGTGTTTTSYLPSYSFYNYSYTQQIYLSSEMNGPSTLTSIAFDASTINSSRVYEIYLMHTTATSADSWLPTDSAVMVYSGNQTFTTGWNTFNFNAPFAYNGTDNLAVIVIDQTGSYTTSNQWRSHSASSTLAKYIYQDSAPYSINTTPSSGSSSSTATRANVKFGGDCDSVSTCIAPNVMVTDYSDDEISIAWVAGDQETSWELEYKTSDTTDWTNVGTLTTNNYTFTDLMPSTNYDIRLRSVCSSSEFSNWVTTSAFTVCEYINVPYTQDFESAAGSGSSYYIDCWFRGTNGSTQYPYASTSYASSGTHSLYFYGTSANYCYGATPRFDDDVPMDSLLVNVNLFATSTGYSIEVGVMSDPTNYNTFVPVGSFTVPVSYIWNNYEITTANYAGNGHYLAFRIPQWGSSYIYLDDLQVDYMNPCDHPTDIAVQSMANDEVTITWTSDADEWEYAYGLTGTVDIEEAVLEGAVTNSATISGLLANTTYDFYLRSVCTGLGESNWRLITFTTECLPLETLPYTQNFDSMSTHTSNTTSGFNNLSDCWHAHNNGTSYTTYPYVYYSSTYANSGSYSLRFYTYTSSAYDDQYAILPSIDTETFPINSLQISFGARRYSTSYPFCVIVGAMTGTDINTFQPIDTVIINTGGTTYDTYIIYFSDFAGTGDRLALMAPKNIGTYVSGAYYNQGHIDNLVLDIASQCPQPTHLEVDEVTSNSVTLSWTENGSANNWVIEYGPEGFTPGNGTEVQANTNPFTVTNLATATVYDFYVAADCGSDQSAQSGPVAATPGSFNMAVTGTNSITTCAMVIYDDGGPNGDYSTNCSSILTINPEIPGNLVSISGNVNIESNWDYLYVYDGTDVNSTPLATYTGTATITDLTSTTGPLTLKFTSDGSVVYPGFQLTVSCISNTCPTPSSISVSNVGNTSATVSWVPAGNETSWIVEHKTTDATTWTTNTATTTSYQLTGLTGLTTYEVRVKADCGDETSNYKSTTFTTPNCAATDACEHIFVLGDEYGDGWNDGYLTLEQNGVVVATLEAIDHELNDTPTYDSVAVVLCNGIATTLVWHTGEYDDEISITLIGPDGTTLYTVTDLEENYASPLHTFTPDCSGAGPVITNPTVTTDAATALGQDNATLNATITNPSDVAITAKGFEWKLTNGGTYAPINGTGTGNTFTANLTGLTPSTSYTFKAFITFNGTTVYGSETTFTTLPQGVDPCDVPTGLHATDIENHAVTIAWDDNANVDNWNIQYRIVGSSALSSATSSTNTYTITNLNGDSDYEIQVQADCGSGNLSDWSAFITVHTTNVGIENWLENSISLFPNPAREYVDIRVDGDVNVTSMEVYDVYGKVVRTVNTIDNPTRINVNGLANGMYFVRVSTDNGMVTKSFVKK